VVVVEMVCTDGVKLVTSSDGDNDDDDDSIAMAIRMKDDAIPLVVVNRVIIFDVTLLIPTRVYCMLYLRFLYGDWKYQFLFVALSEYLLPYLLYVGIRL